MRILEILPILCKVRFQGHPRTETHASHTDFVTSCQNDLDRAASELERALALSVKEKDEAVARYKTEEARRRKLLDLVHELKGNIRVVCRIRPVLPSDETHGNTQVAVQRVSREVVRMADSNREFEFDEVFGQRSTQEDVFEEVRPMVEAVLEGHHACIFAYGQTGSGKTHTMAGTVSDRGVNYRSLETLFAMRQTGLDSGAMTTCAFFVCNVEIYNERVRDLLTPSSSTSTSTDLEIRQDLVLGVHLPTVKRMGASTMDEVLDIIAQGQRNRAQGHTEMNHTSSRSHSVVMIDVETNRADAANVVNKGRLVLVDLAGSERLNKSGVSGERQREAQNINKSLSALGDVIAALGSKQNHVPFRNSKLTYLLQDSLGSDNKVMMIVQVAPTQFNAPESACTLAFGSRARAVELGKSKTQQGVSSSVRPAITEEQKQKLEQKVALLDRTLAETQARLGEAETKAAQVSFFKPKTDRLTRARAVRAH
jgi:kinesin family protein C2/C3